MNTSRFQFTAHAMVLLVLGAAAHAQATRPVQAQRTIAQVPVLLDQWQKIVIEQANPDQKPKIDAAFEHARGEVKKLEASLKEPGADRREIAQKMMTQLRELRTDVEAVLTPEQIEKLRDKLPTLAGNAPADAVLLRLRQNIDKLDLNDEQKQKIQSLEQETREKIRKLRQDTAGDRQALMQNMRELRQQMGTRLEEILTTQQQQKLRELMRANRPDAAGQNQ